MAKSKNHTAHNQTRKAHRNGIYKPQYHKYTKTKGMDPKFLRNQKWANKHNLSPKQMKVFQRKRRVTKLLDAYYAKHKVKLARRSKHNKAAKDQPKKEGVKLGAYGLKRENIYQIALTPHQKFAKKYRFISRAQVKKQKIFKGRTELIKKIVKGMYQKEVAQRYKKSLKRTTALPAASFVKFNPRKVLGIKKSQNKNFKQIRSETAKENKAQKKSTHGKAGGKSDKKVEKKAEKKPEKGKEKPKADKKSEKPKSDKPKAEKPKKA